MLTTFVGISQNHSHDRTNMTLLISTPVWARGTGSND